MTFKHLTYVFLLLFVTSCATSKPMDIVQANDNLMSCNELKLAIEKANVNEDIAHSNKGITDENILSGLFFFPAYFVTYGTSIHAQYNASERKEHLLKLYNKKSCGERRGQKYQEMISNTLFKLEKIKTQYIKGYIDEEEYLLARQQLLLEFD